MFRRRKQRQADKEAEFADLTLGDSTDLDAWIGEGAGGDGDLAADEPVAERPSPKPAGRRRHRADDEDDEPVATLAPIAAAAAVPPPAARAAGPWDEKDAPGDDGVNRIDLGALQVPTPPEVELRLEADPNGQIVTVALFHGVSTLNLGVFAAPRSEGIWEEVREDLRNGIQGDGGQVEEVQGEFGIELYAQVPTPDGLQPLRFVGVDGPRWFVRAVFSGHAAIDPDQAGPLGEVLGNLVVVRGIQPMPVRDPLPLQLPAEVAEQAAAAQQEAEDDGGRHRHLDPPQRGPEITEIH